MKYIVKTFGCQQNVADSERIKTAFQGRGFTEAKTYNTSNYVIINTCMIREAAENRLYGLVNNLSKLKLKHEKKGNVFKIIVTGCIVGMAHRDKKQLFMSLLRKRMPSVDEFMPIEEVGFDTLPLRSSAERALVPISNGCNNFCTFCVVPFTRGRETSRPYDEIIRECFSLKQNGYKKILLIGQNVNSYGADLVAHKKSNLKQPIYVKHLGRHRIPTLFPYLLEDVAKLGFDLVDFISSNPWDFSDELINVIKENANITRVIHLPVQSGDTHVLKRMNRWYTREEYLELVEKLKSQIPSLKITTDIIVGFCGETDEEFNNTVNLCKQVGFEKAYIAQYSSRPMTLATKKLTDNVLHSVKEKRWKILEDLINKPFLEKLKQKK